MTARVAWCLRACAYDETLVFTALRAEGKGGTTSAVVCVPKRRLSHVQGDRPSSG